MTSSMKMKWRQKRLTNKDISDRPNTGGDEIVKLKCHLCGNEWDYKGSHPFYATCPRCLRKVKVKQEG